MEPKQHPEYAPPSELPHFEEDAQSRSPEKYSPTPEVRGATPPTAIQTQDQTVVSAAPVNLPVGLTSTTNDASITNSATAALIADDTDLIEKEWVTRAKAIVNHTKDDPYQQNKEITKIKADYLKKRYNKDLKISET